VLYNGLSTLPTGYGAPAGYGAYGFELVESEIDWMPDTREWTQEALWERQQKMRALRKRKRSGRDAISRFSTEMAITPIYSTTKTAVRRVGTKTAVRRTSGRWSGGYSGLGVALPALPDVVPIAYAEAGLRNFGLPLTTALAALVFLSTKKSATAMRLVTGSAALLGTYLLAQDAMLVEDMAGFGGYGASVSRADAKASVQSAINVLRSQLRRTKTRIGKARIKAKIRRLERRLRRTTRRGNRRSKIRRVVRKVGTRRAARVLRRKKRRHMRKKLRKKKTAQYESDILPEKTALPGFEQISESEYLEPSIPGEISPGGGYFDEGGEVFDEGGEEFDDAAPGMAPIGTPAIGLWVVGGLGALGLIMFMRRGRKGGKKSKKITVKRVKVGKRGRFRIAA
jgi:hypothetical protein